MANLTYVNIDDNIITAIEGYAFVGIPSLYYMKINNNKLTTISAHTFETTDIRDGLDLSGNNISLIEEHAFGNITSLSLLNLTSNPINCDCGVYPFWSWVIERISINAEATCSNGTLITTLDSSELEKCNPDNCQCLNDGECVMTGGGKVICDCIEHWTGKLCQVVLWNGVLDNL
ncbi:unnamed protein product [Mytilus coruscus]|uniref:EGF-like domain-containing protein n=1 Tax=Mytilus coruscus TaxID=42192 RepID=A0A6J8DYS4_MYTCO|nr:unnamed protein product [Mytilus coruscus]